MTGHTVTLTLMEMHRTERAVLIGETDEPDSERHWLPLSQVEVTPKTDNIVEVEMPEWLAHEKGLI